MTTQAILAMIARKGMTFAAGFSACMFINAQFPGVLDCATCQHALTAAALLAVSGGWSYRNEAAKADAAPAAQKAAQ